MAEAPETAALAVLCRPNGSIVEILFDEMGLEAGRGFFNLVHPSSLGSAHRLLRTAIARRAAIDWQLTIKLGGRAVPLFFSAVLTGRGVFLLGMRDPVASGHFPKVLRQRLTTDQDLSPALRELTARQAKSLHSRQNASHAAGTSEADGSRQKSPRGRHADLRRMLAHDLRNPISGILVAAQYLIEDAVSVLDSQQMTLLRSIESSSNSMLRLLEDMLEPRKPAAKSKTRSDSKYRLEAIDAGDLVEQTILLLREIADTNHIRLRVTRDESAPLLLGDQLRLSKALTALLANAVRSAPSGVDLIIEIKSRHDSVTIHVSQAASASLGQMRVGGAGSPRPHPRAARPSSLAAARRVIQEHGGTITRVPGARQAGFTLTLPRVRQERVGRMSS